MQVEDLPVLARAGGGVTRVVQALAHRACMRDRHHHLGPASAQRLRGRERRGRHLAEAKVRHVHRVGHAGGGGRGEPEDADAHAVALDHPRALQPRGRRAGGRLLHVRAEHREARLCDARLQRPHGVVPGLRHRARSHRAEVELVVAQRCRRVPQRIHRLHHHLALGEVRGERALEQVAAVQQQHAVRVVAPQRRDVARERREPALRYARPVRQLRLVGHHPAVQVIGAHQGEPQRRGRRGRGRGRRGGRVGGGGAGEEQGERQPGDGGEVGAEHRAV